MDDQGPSGFCLQWVIQGDKVAPGPGIALDGDLSLRRSVSRQRPRSRWTARDEAGSKDAIGFEVGVHGAIIPASTARRWELSTDDHGMSTSSL